MNIIDELKSDHAAMLDILYRIKETGVTTEKGQEELRLAKRMLLDHLKKEDLRFYPQLRRAAVHDEQIKRMLEDFAHDMDRITRNAISFFDTYANGGSGIQFASDFGELYATLHRRQEKEETMLYREYEKVAYGMARA